MWSRARAASNRSRQRQTWTVGLVPTARFVLREEQILGRSGEPPGQVATRLTVRRGGRTLLDQAAEHGPGEPGWDGPAVLAHHRAIRQPLVAAPDFEIKPPEVQPFGDVPENGRAALTPLAGPVAPGIAVAPDGLRLRHLFDTAQIILGAGVGKS